MRLFALVAAAGKIPFLAKKSIFPQTARHAPRLEHFPFGRFAFKPYGLSFREKTRGFRSRSARRRCAAASHIAFFKGNML